MLYDVVTLINTISNDSSSHDSDLKPEIPSESFRHRHQILLREKSQIGSFYTIIF